MTDEQVYRMVAEKLNKIRRTSYASESFAEVVKDYNEFAAENSFWMLGLVPHEISKDYPGMGIDSDIAMAESFIPEEILREVYEK